MNYRTPEGRRALALLEAAGYRVGRTPRGLTAMAAGVPRGDRGSFYVWSRDGSFPVLATGDFTDVVRFANAPPEEQQAVEEAVRKRFFDVAKDDAENEELPNLARERGEFELYEAVGPERYARYLTWRQTPHSMYTDKTGGRRNIIEDARGEALPSDMAEDRELYGILGATGYEVWRNLPPPPTVNLPPPQP